MAHLQRTVCPNLHVEMRIAYAEGDYNLAIEKAFELIVQEDAPVSTPYRMTTVFCRASAFACLGDLLPGEGGVIHFAEAIKLFDEDLRVCAVQFGLPFNVDGDVAALKRLLLRKETKLAEEAQRKREQQQREKEERHERAWEQRILAAMQPQVHGRTTKNEETQADDKNADMGAQTEE